MSGSTLRKPQPLSFDGNVAENWCVFEQQFRIYWKAALKKKDDDEVAYTLLNLAGQEAVEREQTFVYKPEIKEGQNVIQVAESKENPETLIQKFTEHCNPKKNVVVERHLFNSRSQKPSESVESFVSDLRKKAANCEYGTLVNDLLRDRIVCGCHNEEARTQMLKEGNLTLERAIEILVLDELAKQRKIQLGAMKEDVHAVSCRPKTNRFKANTNRSSFNANKTPFNGNKSSCLNCVGSHPRKPEKCPAYGKRCNKCGVQNHFAKYCMRYKQQQHQRKPKQIHGVDDDNNQDDDNESYYYVIDAIGPNKKAIFTNLLLQNTKIKVKVDTGAKCNVMPLEVLQQINPNIMIDTNKKVKLVAYGGDTFWTEG